MNTPIAPIIPDPRPMYRMGLRNLMDLIILIETGRAGVDGITSREITRIHGIHFETIATGCQRLRKLGLVAVGMQRQPKGKSIRHLTITKRGWKLLTAAEDLAMRNAQAMASADTQTPPKETTL